MQTLTNLSETGQQQLENLKAVGQENIEKLQAFGQENLTKLQTFSTENRALLQTVGLVAVAAVTGAIAGGFIAQGIMITQGALVTKGVAATTGVAATKAAASTAPVLATNGTLASNLATGGVALGAKVMALFNGLTSNAVPITVGAAGGGAIGWKITQREVGPVKQQVAEHSAQIHATQVETSRLQAVVTETATNLKTLQVQQAAPPAEAPAPVAPTLVAPTQVAPSAQDALEDIHGIGPIFAQRLRTAGVFTFAQLAVQTPEALRTIIGPVRASSMFHPEAWIAEAQQRAGISSETTTASGE